MISRLLDIRHRRDRWWRYQVLADAFLQAQRDAGRELDPLRLAFRRIGHGRLPAEFQDVWSEWVALGAHRCEALSAEDCARVEALVSDLNPAALPAMAWLDLYRLALGVGLFSLGLSLRECAQARMIRDSRQASSKQDQWLRAFYAQLELDRHDEARQSLHSLERSNLDPEKRAQARWLLALLGGNPVAEPMGFQAFASPQDRAFGADVRGRKLAFVGPVPSEASQGRAIDAHDLVVKFNHRGGDRGCDPVTQGRRLDISYYNNEQAKTLAGLDFEPVLATLKWGVFVNRKGRSLLPRDAGNLRQLASFKWMLPDTHYNAGPAAIVDLLRFQPAAIRVYNTDLMLSAGRFSGYTPSHFAPVDYVRSFIMTHDPVVQYRLLRRLWELGYLTGDPRFEEVMAMGVAEYMKRLQAVHGADRQALI